MRTFSKVTLVALGEAPNSAGSSVDMGSPLPAILIAMPGVEGDVEDGVVRCDDSQDKIAISEKPNSDPVCCRRRNEQQKPEEEGEAHAGAA